MPDKYYILVWSDAGSVIISEFRDKTPGAINQERFTPSQESEAIAFLKKLKKSVAAANSSVTKADDLANKLRAML